MKISDKSMENREALKLKIQNMYDNPSINFKRTLTIDETIEVLEEFKKDLGGDGTKIVIPKTIIEHDDETDEDFTTLVLFSFVDEDDNNYRVVNGFYAVDEE